MFQAVSNFEKQAEKMSKEKLAEEDERRLLKEPHSIVIHRGKVGQFVRCLERDMRSVVEPFTATKLKVNSFWRVFSQFCQVTQRKLKNVVVTRSFEEDTFFFSVR